MAPLPSSCSTEVTTTTTKNPNHKANFISNCLLSSAFLQTPFSPLSSHHSKPPFNSDIILRHLHDSLASVTHRCFQTLSSVAQGNPVFHKLFSFSASLRNVSQIRFKDYSSTNCLSMTNFAAILPGDSVAGLVAANGILNFLNIYNTLLICRLVLTWFPSAPPVIVSPLSTLCDPYLNIFRGLIPPLGGTLDLSPILAFLVLNAFTSAASALPAELPPTGAVPRIPSSSQSEFLNLTTTQEKWMRRVSGIGSKKSGGLN
ncbi:hypothetical protein GIB67_015037 [Kingdonia uniflora]|uniref:Uncharacterized protein n=2 Tax=Kingdonia uniflora TaxID=39325 RepID=A0A7J7NVA1_9MAGN|nr:hypothetical protein GIB67_015037 [Kingdonia uniflora]